MSNELVQLELMEAIAKRGPNLPPCAHIYRDENRTIATDGHMLLMRDTVTIREDPVQMNKLLSAIPTLEGFNSLTMNAHLLLDALNFLISESERVQSAAALELFVQDKQKALVLRLESHPSSMALVMPLRR